MTAKHSHSASEQQSVKRAHDSKLVFGYVHEIIDILKQAHHSTDGSNHDNSNNSNTSTTTTQTSTPTPTQSLSLFGNIPVDVIDLCLLYYYLNIHETAWHMTDTWDAWDAQTMHSAMFVDPDDKEVLCRKSQGVNPYSFGTHGVNSGISIWRFEVLQPSIYWIGIVDESLIHTDVHQIETRMDNFYMIYVEGGQIDYKQDASSKRTQSSKEHLRFGQNNGKGDVGCMCLEYSTANTTANNAKPVIKLSFSKTKSEFVEICGEIDATRKYKLCVSQRSGAKLKLVASTHFE